MSTSLDDLIASEVNSAQSMNLDAFISRAVPYVVDVETLSKEIVGGKYEGSSLKDGVMYHEMPFGNLSSLPFHRGGTIERLQQIKDNFHVKNKTVLDVGCSVGAISIGCAKEGADVLGVDYDGESIRTAIGAAERLGVKNANFQVATVDLNWSEKVSSFDLIIWLSNWMWIVKQQGLETAKDILFNISSKSSEMMFESASDDGGAGISGLTQEQVKLWLDECTGYTSIKTIKSPSGWMDRDVHVCKENQVIWSGSTSNVARISRHKIRKTFWPEYRWMLDREVEFMRLLEKYDIAPKVLEVGDDYIDMTYAGKHLSSYKDTKTGYESFADQFKKIAESLKREKIIHRDIHIHNLLYFQGKVRLIDFGWGLFEGEEEVPSAKRVPYAGLSFGLWNKVGKSDSAVLEQIAKDVCYDYQYDDRYGIKE